MMITQEELKRLLNYDPNTGVWTYRIWRGGSAPRAGAVACRPQHEPWQIRIGKQLYQPSRLAFLYMTGRWPKTVDHINQDRSDNRWCNLREATKQQQSANRRGWAQSGFKGVRQESKGCFLARIGVGGKIIYLGSCPTAEEAHQLYQTAALKYFGEFARSNHIGG